MNLKLKQCLPLLAAALFGWASMANAGVVVSAGVTEKLDKAALARVWTIGRIHGKRVTVIELPRENETRLSFYRIVFELNHEKAIRGFWTRELFQGSATAPVVVDDEEEMFSFLREHPDAIGILSEKPAEDSGLKILLTY